jgi:thioredoxin 1
MAPILEGLAGELAPDVAFAKLNADEEPGLAAQFQVEGIPTLLLFERGRLVDRVVGAYPRDALGAGAPKSAQ